MNRIRKPKIAYDPVYNFHPGYHAKIVSSTQEDIIWVPSSLSNYSEGLIRSDDANERSQILNLGRFELSTNVDAIFSPHVLLDSDIPYFIEVEDIWWLFGDTYEEVYPPRPLDRFKIDKFEEYVMRSELKHVLWWSHAAAERLSEFCKLNNIRRCVERKITKNSSIVYPAEEVLISSRKNVEGSKRKSILAVFSENTLSRKGGDVVLELFTGLDEIGYSNWGLVIYGDFSQCFIDSYSEYTNIKFRQKVGLDALQTEMVRSDIFVFLSKMDTFGTVLIQAINSGQFILTIESIYALALNEVLSVYPNYLSLGNYTSLDLDSKINVLKNFLNKEIKFNNSFRSPFTLKIMRKQLLNIINLIYE